MHWRAVLVEQQGPCALYALAEPKENIPFLRLFFITLAASSIS